MSKIITKFSANIVEEINHLSRNFYLWIPVFFGFGAAFFISFETGFRQNNMLLLLLFFVAIVLSFINRHSFRSLIFVACALFLMGGFYVVCYQKMFFDHTKITGKVYVDGIGKVDEIRTFTNDANSVTGVSLILVDPILHKANFANKKASSAVKKVKKKRKSKRKISHKTIQNNFINLDGYQEIDRAFLNRSHNYQQVDWIASENGPLFPDPPKKISVSLKKNYHTIGVGDVVKLRILLQPPRGKMFPDDFDFEIYLKSKKIGARGFAFGDVEIIKKAEISNMHEWFASLRQAVRVKINQVLDGDQAGIAMAFLIGDKRGISHLLMDKIRYSGLAHLLSISGFHLSLAGLILFASVRLLFSRSEYLMLHFDLKKMSAVIAIFGSYFYLQMAGSPLPAQRAFLMILMLLIALFLDEKPNVKRAVMMVALVLMLMNPFALFSVGFQLSFAAILVLGSSFSTLKTYFDASIVAKMRHYFWGIISTSIVIQMATAPILMRSFQDVALLGFVANMLAIPVTAFVVMPLGILSLFLMPLGLEKYALMLMGQGVALIEKVTVFTADMPYSHVMSPKLSALGLLLAVIGLLLMCLSKTRIRFVGVVIFLSSFLTFFGNQKPDIAFEGEQRFFVIYDQKEGMVISKKQRDSKRLEAWKKKFAETEVTILENSQCDKIKCFIEKEKKILVLLGRNKIADICAADYDIIVNMSKKYRLPDCILKGKLKIDNLDFHQKGGHFIYFDPKAKNNMRLEVSSPLLEKEG